MIVMHAGDELGDAFREVADAVVLLEQFGLDAEGRHALRLVCG